MSPEELLFREAMELHMQEKDCKASDTSALTCGSRQTLQVKPVPPPLMDMCCVICIA